MADPQPHLSKLDPELEEVGLPDSITLSMMRLTSNVDFQEVWSSKVTAAAAKQHGALPPSVRERNITMDEQSDHAQCSECIAERVAAIRHQDISSRR